MGITASVVSLGFLTSNYPNIYRDGGGGGQVNGLNLIMFSDGMYTSGGVPNDNNLRNFTSNSIAVSGYQGAPIQAMTDFGTADKGPKQQIPYFYNNGENDLATGIWPNQNLVTLCDGHCAVSFPEVIARDPNHDGMSIASLYNTAVKIEVGAYGPVVTRPTMALFRAGEPLFGTFCALGGIDGYIYTFARITESTPAANGLKLARVPWGGFADRSQYRYWNGAAYVAQMPAYHDGGKSNVFNWTQEAFGKNFGPGYGEIFWSQVYQKYLLLFQSANAAGDNNVYASLSANLESGWSTPQSIWKLPTFSDGYTYSFHAYPQYDPTSKVIPITWNQFSESQSYRVGMANITFS
ncbi:hypothetical protein B0H66DRAFT_98761 [Apodospora peruviana]|uniref:Uncharacterized protein n=1 Tax=Apodospora peruviana TaxID=516989 RepID=A0AAE0MGM7_9PEZI|nr:hypothetical protein B0H66DRAFT_98761 [Apodospora peruviana]